MAEFEHGAALENLPNNLNEEFAQKRANRYKKYRGIQGNSEKVANDARKEFSEELDKSIDQLVSKKKEHREMRTKLYALEESKYIKEHVLPPFKYAARKDLDRYMESRGTLLLHPIKEWEVKFLSSCFHQMEFEEGGFLELDEMLHLMKYLGLKDINRKTVIESFHMAFSPKGEGGASLNEFLYVMRKKRWINFTEEEYRSGVIEGRPAKFEIEAQNYNRRRQLRYIFNPKLHFLRTQMKHSFDIRQQSEIHRIEERRRARDLLSQRVRERLKAQHSHHVGNDSASKWKLPTGTIENRLAEVSGDSKNCQHLFRPARWGFEKIDPIIKELPNDLEIIRDIDLYDHVEFVEKKSTLPFHFKHSIQKYDNIQRTILSSPYLSHLHTPDGPAEERKRRRLTEEHSQDSSEEDYFSEEPAAVDYWHAQVAREGLQSIAILEEPCVVASDEEDQGGVRDVTDRDDPHSSTMETFRLVYERGRARSIRHDSGLPGDDYEEYSSESDDGSRGESSYALDDKSSNESFGKLDSDRDGTEMDMRSEASEVSSSGVLPFENEKRAVMELELRMSEIEMSKAPRVHTFFHGGRRSTTRLEQDNGSLRLSTTACRQKSRQSTRITGIRPNSQASFRSGSRTPMEKTRIHRPHTEMGHRSKGGLAYIKEQRRSEKHKPASDDDPYKINFGSLLPPIDGSESTKDGTNRTVS